ncbi:MAG: cyclopropane-fatty-acyl-phospholipid synthase family protein, partial [Burkholderiales bacterium]|nr:cyclopropane-fatty-acyl-phospholipid synthase family protein [Burkholderiales bacterium]
DGAAAALARGRWLRRPLQRLLRAISHGALRVEWPDGAITEAQGAQPGPRASIQLLRWRALARLALGGDLGLAESYRDGDWTTPDLAALLHFGSLNEASWGARSRPAWPARWLGRAWHWARANTRRGSRRNIAEHYDLGNAFYARWLDPELIYSSAIYSDPAQTLEQAQAAKLECVIERLQLDALPAGGEILEIGCGWGALALALARRHPCRVTGITLSQEQLAHARARVAASAAPTRVELRLQDYRDLDGRYDRIVSIEMLEAVGERYWPVYFETLRRCLRPDGVAVVQVITIAEAHFEAYRRHPDFIQRHIFPGGMLPSPAILRRETEKAGLRWEDVHWFGSDYATTLSRWQSAFQRAWPRIVTMVPGGSARAFDDRFKRLWEYYLAYCEAGFRAGWTDVGQCLLARPA